MFQSNSLRMSLNPFAARFFEVKEVLRANFTWLDCDWLCCQPTLTTWWRLLCFMMKMHDDLKFAKSFFIFQRWQEAAVSLGWLILLGGGMGVEMV